MIRLFGYILGAISGLSLIGSTLTVIFQLFITEENDNSSDYGEILAVAAMIITISFIVFYYVYQTGFGKSKLEKIKEELEILKIRHEINKLKE